MKKVVFVFAVMVMSLGFTAASFAAVIDIPVTYDVSITNGDPNASYNNSAYLYIGDWGSSSDYVSLFQLDLSSIVSTMDSGDPPHFSGQFV